jgi:hypothetical protein
VALVHVLPEGSCAFLCAVRVLFSPDMA